MKSTGNFTRLFLPSLFFCVLISAQSFAQQKGSVTVIKDAKIDSLLAKHAELNSGTAKGNLITTEGYRVQIFSGAERNQIYEEQSRFKIQYPQVRSYITYSQPNYKLRVGDFRTRIEAEKFMNELRRYYPSMFVFAERINLR